VAGGIGRTVADGLGQDFGTYVGGRYPIKCRGPAAGGGYPAVGCLEARVIIEVGQVLK
jgi:hypothetical protein